MPRFSQGSRPFRIDTPLGEDAVLLAGFDIRESLNEPFEIEAELLAESPINFANLLGSPATITAKLTAGGTRHWNGIVAKLGQGGQVRSMEGAVVFTRYRVRIVPRLWLLSRRTNCRIFQQISVPEILQKILKEHMVEFKSELQGKFPARDYCVQYRESDLDFLHRLMEEEGIHYHFRHTEDAHLLVLGNSPQSHQPCAGPDQIYYDTYEDVTRLKDFIDTWYKEQEIRSTKQTMWDHCFELTGKNLEAVKPLQKTAAAGEVQHNLTAGSSPLLELYDYPGGYAQRFDGVDPGGGDRAAELEKIFDDNKRTATIRIQEEAAQALKIHGGGYCPQLAAGHRFELALHFDADGQYLLTDVHHRGSFDAWYLPRREEVDLEYRCTFTCLPAEIPFRPRRRTAKPVIAGTQAATVVGPKGEEIFTDKHGRVKVQFPWDREGKEDADSSCWVRVSQVHAGKHWGGIDIPRIREEVVVAFEEGDPDRPLIVGRVYNDRETPPFDLPGKKMVSGLKSNTYPGGGGFNEISMDDTAGKQLMNIQAEFDQTELVKHDQKGEIGNNRTVKVAVDDSETVGNNQTVDVGVNQTINVGTNQTTTVGQKIVIDAGVSITLKCGASMIHMNQAGFITISGTVITTAAAANLAMTAPLTEVVGGVMLSCVGGVTLVEGGVTHIGSAKLTSVTSKGQIDVTATGDLIAKGAMIKLNG